MDIQRINESQVRVTLSQDDLETRNIKVTELVYGSEKTHQLLQEVVQKAHSNGELELVNRPLMAELLPLSPAEPVTIVVTQVNQAIQSPAKQTQGVKWTPRTPRHHVPPLQPPQKPDPRIAHQALFCFADMDTAAQAAYRVVTLFNGQSRLYKYERAYFLFLANAIPFPPHFNAMVAEYGQRQPHAFLTSAFLAEHGETIIATNALQKLICLI